MHDLEKKIGQPFVKDRHGIRQTVTLEEIRRDKVKVREVESGNCAILPTAKFLKFYEG